MKNFKDFINHGERTAKILLCGKSQELQEMLLKNQLDFFLADPENITDPDYKKFEALIIEPENLGKINIAELHDIKIFTFVKPDFMDSIKKSAGFIKICRDENDLIMNIIASVTPDVFLRKQADILYIKKSVTTGYNFIFANAGDADVITDAELYLPGDYDLLELNLETGEKTVTDYKIKGDIKTFRLEIKSGESKLFCAGKKGG